MTTFALPALRPHGMLGSGPPLRVRHPIACTTPRRRARARQHLIGAAVDPPARACRGRCAPKRRDTLANGTTRAISEIREGDEVLATNTGTGETQARTVTATMVMHHDGDLLDLTIEDDDGQGVIQTSDRHPFWSVTDSEWEHAIDLSVGEQLRQADGSTATVVSSPSGPAAKTGGTSPSKSTTTSTSTSATGRFCYTTARRRRATTEPCSRRRTLVRSRAPIRFITPCLRSTSRSWTVSA